MKKSNEINMIPHSSELSGGPRGRAPAPTLMYLIELDPNVSSCLAEGSLPLQMLNVNENNTHYLIPLQGTDPLEIMQYKQHEEIQGEPSVSSQNVQVEPNIIGTNGKVQSNQSKTRDLDGLAHTSKRTAVYGSHLVDLKSNNNGREETFEESLSATEILSTGPLDAQSLPAPSTDRPARKYVHIADSVPPPRAVLSLPAALRLHNGRVTPRKLLPPACFGPVRGVERDVTIEEARELELKAAASSKPVFLLSKGDSFRHIDVSDQEKCNWLGLLPLGSARSANVWLQQRGGELFAVSPRRLPPRAALRLAKARLPDHHHHEEEQPARRCEECGQELQGPPQRHECPEVFKCNRRKRRYRCKYCALPFSRVFTLKRHVSLHCKSKATKTAAHVEPEPADVLLSAATTDARTEDDRTASDESFHTFSMDFSAPLFDPDRMPALDLARDDSLLGEPADTTMCTPDIHFPPVDYSKKVAKAASLIKCPHCQQTMSSNMKQRHKRQCASRSVSCACGHTCRDARRLARHVRAHHAPTPTPHKGDVESSSTTYKCDQCQNTFKRRGMLVNHVWRAHGAAARVPLQRRQRHYPCVACPKLYRSAAKRDTHVRTHHPGAELMRAQCIDSGAVCCEPAACPACPRQYATRAKMLQHMRRHHPLLAPPSKSKLPKQA